jgi:polyisoprenoid-binding protein YceI
MTRKTLAFAILLTFLTLGAVHAAAAARPAAGAWTLDAERSLVSFTITKFGYADVDGRFTRFSGDFRYDPARPADSSIRWRVRVGSVQTDEPGRDRSLQSRQYFDAARYPDLSFVSDRVRALDGGRLEVAGRITIKGRTRPLTVIARPVASGAGFETRFELDRYDFGVAGGGMMRALIGRTVHVHLVALPKGEAR